MNSKNRAFISFIITAIVTAIVVFALCLAIELDLLFRCEAYVTKKELSIENLVKFATIDQLEKRLKNEPSNYIVELRLAKMYEELGKYSQSNTLYQDALKKSGRSNYTLYSYALFCAKRGLYTISSSLAEDISGNTKKNIKYRAEIYSAMANKMFENKEYNSSINAYHIAYKYAKNAGNSRLFNDIKDKYALSYVKLADGYIENKLIKEAISALNNSIKIKETQIALYKLGLIYIETDKAKAQKYIETVFKNEPYLVNPYIYVDLLDELIKQSEDTNNLSMLNYYSVKRNRFKTIMSNIYLYKNDILINKSVVTKDKNNYYLSFDLRNNTKERIEQLYLDIDLHLNSRWYRLSKKIVYLSNVLQPYEELLDYKIKLPSNIEFLDIKDNNYLIVKYYAKKSTKAPRTLIKVESLNF